jgi:hypothetical protein
MKTEIIHDSDGNRTETDFDNQDNVLQVRDYGKDGELLRKIEYNYNDIKVLLGWDEYCGLSLVRLYKIEFNNGSNMVNVYDTNGVLLESTPQ